MSLQRHLLFWIFVTALITVFLVLFKSVLTPFILGMTIAYLLNPAMNALGRMKVSRMVSALIILSLFFLFVFALLGVTIPILYRELTGLAQDMPGYVDNILHVLQPYSAHLQSLIAPTGESSDLKSLLGEHIGSAINIAKAILDNMTSSGQAVGSFFSTLIFTPIVAYFMMKEWNSIKEWIIDLFPRDHKTTMMELLKEIDKKISGFVRGQIMVALSLAAIYSIALSLAGLKYGFLIGLVAGLFSIIPMVGSIGGLIVGVAMAYFQGGEWSFIGLIAGIFIIGQIIEGNFLTPKLVGDSVGLHPLWVFFAVLAGGALLGITGMFLAVPVAAITGVLIVFAIKTYKASPFYKATPKPKKPAAKNAKKK